MIFASFPGNVHKITDVIKAFLQWTRNSNKATTSNEFVAGACSETRNQVTGYSPRLPFFNPVPSGLKIVQLITV